MSSQKREYHHFIPRFLLKNFAHPFICPKAPKPGPKCKKRHHKKGKYPNDPVVNCLQLAPERFRIEEQSVAEVCGMNDMYTNWAPTAKNPRELETKFSHLEGKASHVIRHIIESQQRGQDNVELTRTQQITLRKFIYLQKKRGSGFYEKYNCKSIDDYDINDRVLLKDFMDKKKMHRPIDVWLHALSSIIDLDMDVDKDWRKTLKSTIYYSIAHEFEEHITAFWMSFCTLADTNEEFILTDMSYLVSEGPTEDYQDARTGEWLQMGPCFHMFAPVSPRLMIVLRSKHLPEPFEDKNDDRKAVRAMWRQIEIDSMYGEGKTSILEDLPVHKALNNYSEIIDGRLVMRPDWDWQLRQSDTFWFPFFTISTQHGRIINGLLLDHAFVGSTIIFNQKESFLELLEWFLTEPCNVGKRIGGQKQQDQEKYIERLTEFIRAEGRDIAAETTWRPTWHHLDFEKYRNRNIFATRWLEKHERDNGRVDLDEFKQKEVPTNQSNSDVEELDIWKNAATRWLEELNEDHSHVEPDGVEQREAHTNHQDPDVEGFDNSTNSAVKWLDSLGEQNVGMKSIRDQYENPNETTTGHSSGENFRKESEFGPNDIERQSILERIAKYGDGSQEDVQVAEIYWFTTPQWRSITFGPDFLSTWSIEEHVAEEADVMFRVWLINATLDKWKDSAATDRLGRLLERYQSRQGNTIFWLFLKNFRYCIWRHEYPVALLEEQDLKGPEDEVLEAMPMLKTSTLNAKMWKAMAHDLAHKHGLDINMSPAELTSLCSGPLKRQKKRQPSANDKPRDVEHLEAQNDMLRVSICFLFGLILIVVMLVCWISSPVGVSPVELCSFLIVCIVATFSERI